MITDEEIELAKSETTYTLDSQLHQHNDCIRIAYQWFDAQNKTKRINPKGYALKHIIESWGGRYISNSDVCVAAQLHPDIQGKYPRFNISARLTEPSLERLNDIPEAMAHHDRDGHKSSNYKIYE